MFHLRNSVLRCCIIAAPVASESIITPLHPPIHLLNPVPSTTTAERITDTQKRFLEEFREKLRSDALHADLERFVAGSPEDRSDSVGKIERGVEPLPPWVKLKLSKTVAARPKYNKLAANLKRLNLSTVCQEAKCPNIGECWGGGEDGEEVSTATIMLMGSHCTRGCRFCSVATSRAPPPLDPMEPKKTAVAVSQMGVEYIVLTMVDRDDLVDGGAKHVATTVQEMLRETPSLLIECLVGDFRGNLQRVEEVATSGMHVFAHNIECVERMTPTVRDRRATYRQSLKVLEHAATLRNPDGIPLLTKSSIMLGVGERSEEIRQCLVDLRTAGVAAVTLGQYLQPSRTRMKVERYAHPDEFEQWKNEALGMGFVYCASGPMVRSSYRAGEYYLKTFLRKQQQQAK